jgi:DNA-directed RNA polymerase specialized sigma24 family protein
MHIHLLMRESDSSPAKTVRTADEKRRRELTPEAFGQLLNWLDQDRDRAGLRYEQIRSRLIKVFQCRGCAAAEDLADETINRVAGKVFAIAASYVGDPALYFYGVAEKIYLESLRRTPALFVPLPASVAEKETRREEPDQRFACLERCMERLSYHHRELVLAYYGQHKDPKSKINHRKKLSEQMGIGPNALWIRVHRIREGLKKCVAECLQRRPESLRRTTWS